MGSEMTESIICVICFNNEIKINQKLTKLNWEKMLINCKTYLDTSIIDKSFENETQVTCCNYCYESTRQLLLLEEQVQQLQKEISDLSSLFSKNVLERRNLVKNETNESANNLTPRIEKCFTIQSNIDRNSSGIPKNGILRKEVKNESVANELPSDSERKTEKYDFVTDNCFDTDQHENVTKDECENYFHSDDEIDVKYSFDEALAKVVNPVNKEIVARQQISSTNTHGVQKAKTISVSELLKGVKMPIIKLKRIQPCTSRKSAKIVTVPVPGEKTVKCENNLDENTSYKCSICGESFITFSDIQDHNKLHNKPGLYSCCFCKKSFNKSSTLKMHQMIHTGQRPHKCSVCSKTFMRADRLKEHKLIHSGEKPYKCSLCATSFRHLGNLKRHRSIHFGETPYKCSFCDKSFKKASTLKTHETIHSGKTNRKTPYKCSFCEKSFRWPDSLKIHERIHTGERPFNCSFCSKSFTSSGSLRVHEINHSGKRPHKCFSCPKSFASPGKLKRHEEVHSTKRPHECPKCEKTFKRTDQLVRHRCKFGETTEEFILP